MMRADQVCNELKHASCHVDGSVERHHHKTGLAWSHSCVDLQIIHAVEGLKEEREMVTAPFNM